MYIHYGVGSLGMYILCRYGALGFGLSVAAAAQDGSATATFYIHIHNVHTSMQYALHTYVHMHCFHGYQRKDTCISGGHSQSCQAKELLSWRDLLCWDESSSSERKTTDDLKEAIANQRPPPTHTHTYFTPSHKSIVQYET